MLQKYGSLRGELKLVELDCSTHRSGLGVCVSGSRNGRITVSELKPGGAAAADGQISVGDELLEINGQVLYGRSFQNAADVISSVLSKVKIVLFRVPPTCERRSLLEGISKGGPSRRDSRSMNHGLPGQRGATRSRSLVYVCTMASSPSGVCTNPAISIALSNHNPINNPTPSFSQIPPSNHVPPSAHNTAAGYTHRFHHKQSNCSSLINPPASGVQSPFYCSACSVRSDPLTCPIIPGCINIIDICKGHSSLGLTIVGGCNTLLGAILIHEVNEGGAAHRDGRLMAGDHILEVNGMDLRMASHEEALSVLRLSPQHVRLCVYRNTLTHTVHSQGTHTHEDTWDLFTVDLQLQPGQELGLSIVGKR
ncbi:multiple PDZ domain protein isoform X2, partial [Silurus asotus]